MDSSRRHAGHPARENPPAKDKTGFRRSRHDLDALGVAKRTTRAMGYAQIAHGPISSRTEPGARMQEIPAGGSDSASSQLPFSSNHTGIVGPSPERFLIHVEFITKFPATPRVGSQ